MYIKYVEPQDKDIIGLEDEEKIRGISEFTFTELEKPEPQSFLATVELKKKEEPKIIVKNGRNKHKKGRDTGALF
jgi:hypothetical protein